MIIFKDFRMIFSFGYSRNITQTVAHAMGIGNIGSASSRFSEKKCWSSYGLTTLAAFPRLSTFRKCKSTRTEKLPLEENDHGVHAIYYSESMGLELVL